MPPLRPPYRIFPVATTRPIGPRVADNPPDAMLDGAMMSNATPTNSPQHAPSDRDQQRLLTAEQVADRWQVSRTHVYGLARAGKIPMVGIGRYYRFSLDALIEWEQPGGTQVYSGRDRRV